MDAAREDRIVRLLQGMAELPPSSWEAFLRAECGTDTVLAHEVMHRQQLLSSRETTSLPQEEDSHGSSSSRMADEPAAARRTTAEFQGNDRYFLRRRIGSGGFGVVYEAHDAVRDSVVALKTLRNLTSGALYRFKREFRLLADVSHRNLVQLYELTSHERTWFFTMELVAGGHFLDHVAPNRAPSTAPASLDRLVRALRQLVDGLGALHRSGHIHRDIKPSNVLVTHDGRVVILDFGLVLDVQNEDTIQSLTIAGTPAFMSPEQAAGLPLTPASDWYSVGVILYQALTATDPFLGNYLQVLTEKQQRDPPPAGSLVDGVPAHLDALCHALLSRDPAARPAEAEILDRLDALRSPSAARPIVHVERRVLPFVGRKHHLARLDEALQEVLAGTPAVATVSGPSGIGKTALVKAFADRIRERVADAVIFEGRCYERESVPYKALDSSIDSLAQYLKRLPASDARALLPRDIDSLAKLFPVIDDLHDRASRRIAVPRDVQELRRRACAALRDVLARLGDAHPLILFIDDLQWGDVDSATLLADVLRPPDAPVLLLIAAYRDVEIQTSPFLRSFFGDGVTSSLSTVRIRVGPLSANEARDLAGSIAPALRVPADVFPVIAAESGGNPFFIGELVRFAGTADDRLAGASFQQPADSDEREATLAHMLQIRISRLPPLSQDVLHIVAVNGQPMPETVLRSAVGEPGIESALVSLRSEHLLRSRETDRGPELEPYHDRIREIVVAALDAERRRQCHGRLAAAWEGEEVADAELVGAHFSGAGDTARAAHYIAIAAEEAESALAFERAARLYRRALDLLSSDAMERGSLTARLALALANAGRCAEAAAVYLAAPVSTSAQAIEFKQKAAQQLLFGGHVTEGLRVIREVLAAIGMSFPESRWETLLALLYSRARVRIRGLRYRRRVAAEVPPGELAKVDACWAVSAGLGVVDTVRGAVFQSRHLMLALRAGELERVHRALCLEAGFAAARGSGAIRRVRQVRRLSHDLVPAVGTAYAGAMQALTDGVCDYLVGKWRAAAVALAEAENRLTGDCTGVTWELDCSRLFCLWSLYHLGELKTIAVRFPVLLKDANDRGDLYASTTLAGLHAHIVYLAAGEPETAARYTREAIDRWPPGGFHLPQLWEMWSLADIAIYERRGVDADARVGQTWAALKRSLLTSVQLTRVSMLDLRGRAALAAAAQSRDAAFRGQSIRLSLRCAAAMERERLPWGSALAGMLRAGADELLGRADLASAGFDRVVHALVKEEMHLIAAVARRRYGELVGGETGSAAIAESGTWMAAQGIRDPDAFAGLFAPARPQDG